jgi:membrane fusion protein
MISMVDVSLFRREVIERSSDDWLGSVRLATPVSLQIWTISALATTAAIVAWLVFGSYTRREHVTGLLIPQAGLLAVTANAIGTVNRVLVSEGEHVHAGDPLITLSGEHVSEMLGDTGINISVQLRNEQAELKKDISDTQSLAAKQGEDIRAQLVKIKGQLRQLEDQADIQQQQIQNEQKLLDKIGPLLEKGYVVLFQIQQERNTLLSEETQAKAIQQQHFLIEQQAIALRGQLDQLPTLTSVKLGELRRQSAQIEQTLEQNEAGRASVFRAPKDGIVSSLLTGPGQTIAVGQTMLAIVPVDSPLQAQLLVPSNAAGFVHSGTRVILHYRPYPYQKFGLQSGVVKEVSRSALSPSEVAALLGGGQSQVAEPQYRVLVDLAAQNIQVYGHDESLKPGMAVDGDLLLDRRHIVEWIFEPLYAAGRRLTSK